MSKIIFKGEYMKKRFLLLHFFLAINLIFLFFSCKDVPLSSVMVEPDTSSLTLNFNGGNLFGDSSIKFNYEEIELLVGMPIDDALVELDFGINNLEKKGYEFLGWTLKRNGNNLVQYLPEYGILYAKWSKLQDENPTINHENLE